MIAYLPRLYGDELFYGWLGRIYRHNGYLRSQDALADVLEIGHGEKFSMEICNRLKPDVMTALGGPRAFQDIALGSTMLPYYCRFMGTRERKGLFAKLSSGTLSAVNYSNVDYPLRSLAYCPLCAREDREKYGEAYFHRLHQVRDMRACPVHGCRLGQVGYLVRDRRNPRLVVAEEAVPENYDAVEALGMDLAYSRWLAEVFQSPMDLKREIPLVLLLMCKLRNARLMFGELFVDYGGVAKEVNGVFRGYGCISAGAVEGVVNGRTDVVTALRIAYTIGIAPQDLCRARSKDVDLNEICGV